VPAGKLLTGFDAGNVATICVAVALVTVRLTPPNLTVGTGLVTRFMPEIVIVPGAVELIWTL
jgi:hypothetical protein